LSITTLRAIDNEFPLPAAATIAINTVFSFLQKNTTLKVIFDRQTHPPFSPYWPAKIDQAQPRSAFLTESCHWKSCRIELISCLDRWPIFERY
jgi:hypothetical protein